METKIPEIMPAAAESWARYDQELQDTRLVPPVSKTGTSPKPVEYPEKRARQEMKKPDLNAEKTKELVEEVKSYLEDLNIQLSFNVNEQTRDVVVKVLNRDTGDIIRQIPAEELVRFREKLKELRGVLFNGKV